LLEKDLYNLQEYLNIAFGTVQHHLLKRNMILIFEEFFLRHQICLGDDNIFDLGEAPLFSNFELRFSSPLDIYCISQSWQNMCCHLVNLQSKVIRWNLESIFFFASPDFMIQNKVIAEPIKKWGPYKLIRTFKSLVVDCNIKLKKKNMWH
jgi:hypothetical protein